MGLVFAGALTVSEAAGASALQLVTTAAGLACLLFTKLSPYALMIAAALVFGAMQFL
jgi:hypothetical protein